MLSFVIAWWIGKHVVDPSWGIGTYTPTDNTYRDSVSYQRTVTTPDGMYQRAPMSCWYTMASAIVRRVEDVAPPRVHIGWNINAQLWNTMRMPGQCLSFCEQGSVVHSSIVRGSTRTDAILEYPSHAWRRTEHGHRLASSTPTPSH